MNSERQSLAPFDKLRANGFCKQLEQSIIFFGA
jgi:hypothetical protein